VNGDCHCVAYACKVRKCVWGHTLEGLEVPWNKKPWSRCLTITLKWYNVGSQDKPRDKNIVHLWHESYCKIHRCEGKRKHGYVICIDVLWLVHKAVSTVSAFCLFKLLLQLNRAWWLMCVYSRKPRHIRCDIDVLLQQPKKCAMSILQPDFCWKSMNRV
jgi:hypothetical protein